MRILRINYILSRVRFLPVIRNHLALRQLIKFAITGGIFTIVDFAIYIFLTRLFLFFEVHYLWANFIGMASGATGDFLLNKAWTFRNHERKVLLQYIKFWVVVVLGMAIYQYLLLFFVEKIELYDILGKAFSAIIVMLIRFTIHKFWTFRITNRTNSIANHYE